MTGSAENDRGFDAPVAYERAKVDKSEAYWTRREDHEAGHPSGFDCHGEAIMPPHEVCARFIPPEGGGDAAL